MITPVTENGWKIVPLADVVDILDAKRIPVNSTERAKRSGDVPYYGATGQVGFIDTHLFDEELVLLGEDGAPFLDPAKPTAYMIRGKSWVNNHAHVLRGKPGLLNSFLLYQLNNLDYRPYVSGTTRLKLPQGPMKQIPILLPSEDEQRRIVAEIEKQFTRLDAGVAALQRVRSKLRQYRASVLKSACEGRLVPTEAVLARQENHDYESADQLLQRILTERRAKWNGRGKYLQPTPPSTPDLPQLPEGWVWASPEQLSAAESYSLAIGPFGSNLKVNDYTDSGVPLIFVRNIRSGTFGGERTVFVSQSKAKELKAHQVSGGDILITKMGAPPGDACLYPESAEDAVITADCIKLRPSEVLKHKRFFVYAINSEIIKPQIRDITKGVAQMKVSLGRFSGIGFPLPPLAEQERILAEVERRLSVVDELEATVTANLKRAARLRQAILQKAFESNGTRPN